jgi:hypothetical protein
LFRVKNRKFTLQILLHVSLLLLFSGCEESNPKSQNYLNHNETFVSITHTKIDKDKSIKERNTRKKLFSNESVINKEKLKDIKTEKYISLNSWWLYAIVISIIVIIFFITLLMKKQKIILDNLRH